ncbi:Fe(3+)-hydroxamate ABC transporter permease FhuB [Proteus alimentorum]|uniref:Fe(3+)-hydroxamate ABC transporter permease FhuB n=1 Tax=Proteus alimentorum TaxID=1973495 RepID=A0ABS0IRQ2_9GAMM|nr:Fe(3+)-hydroxamate ABC transporter permease FhuB [Proteus alimentorum]MBG2874920.1 Fe(3+)-hydroxamate ABC transporter permease FhuB [Proteus alimentorum]MBG2878699.1 Fe(3+)-hydroxamate ABC transporter permease FhuB [Proteus alimentorum]
MKIKQYTFYFLAIILLSIISLQIDNSLSLSRQLYLLTNSATTMPFADVFFLHAQLPRLAMTVVIGGLFGVVGSLMQQLTQNNLTSPLTLGTSSGAWLALVIVNIWFTGLVTDYSAVAATLGALLAFSLVIIIAGIRNMTGLPLVVSGMVVNILLGAIATALVTLNAQFAQNIFMWGAGDLAQDGWEPFFWLLPRITPVLLIFIFAPRILTLLRLGHEGATARGLSVLPAFAFFIILSTWLVSVSITVVGVISFIGLLAPNIVRTLGARTARQELIASGLMGICLLLITDSLAIWAGQWLNTVIPSGVTAAAIGAPALIWFSRKKMQASDQLSISIISQTKKLSNYTVIGITALLMLGLALTLFIHINEHQWFWEVPSVYQRALRFPRLLTALFAGVALAIAGVILQRLIYNPLASPDILGVSSGATFALVFSSLILGSALQTSQWGTALLGSGVVMIILLVLGKRHQYTPASLILTGIALTASLEAFIQFFLAKGSLSSYKILLWLSGSTYRVTEQQAIYFALAIIFIVGIVLLLTRWLALISIGRSFALARGLHTAQASIILLIIVSLLCALVTSTVGPIAFIGLVAPHMAVLIGAQKIKSQLILSGLIGATLMVWADWLGQILIYPAQIAAGTLVAILGGSYFLCLMLLNRSR